MVYLPGSQIPLFLVGLFITPHLKLVDERTFTPGMRFILTGEALGAECETS